MVADCGALLRNIRWVMDNMKSHHAKAVKNLPDRSGWFRSCGYVLSF